MKSNAEHAEIAGRNLRNIMDAQEISQVQLARDLKLSPGTVSSWYTGRRTPRMKNLDALCQYLHCSQADILEEHGCSIRPKLVQTPMPRTQAVSAPVDALDIAIHIRDSDPLRRLFAVAVESDSEALQLVTVMLEALNRRKDSQASQDQQ